MERTDSRSTPEHASETVADLKKNMGENSRLGVKTFVLTADVTEAHRQIPIDPRDWHLLGSQVSPGGPVHVNAVGTFGVASASHYRSRVAPALGRVAQFVARKKAETFHMLVADD